MKSQKISNAGLDLLTIDKQVSGFYNNINHSIPPALFFRLFPGFGFMVANFPGSLHHYYNHIFDHIWGISENGIKYPATTSK
jgi:hypothetical protein